jgi:molybdopterin synthase catalytic subunit
MVTMIKLQNEDFDIGALIEAAKVKSAGAIVSFLGVVRDDDIEKIELEAYQEMAEKDLDEIRNEAMEKFRLLDVDIIHRTGELLVGENIVLIIASSAHRKEAFLGCEYIIDRIKKTTPIWKKEYLTDGTRWVEGEALRKK